MKLENKKLKMIGHYLLNRVQRYEPSVTVDELYRAVKDNTANAEQYAIDIVANRRGTRG